MPGDLQRILGRNLAANRMARGLSQEEFAFELAWHRTYVGGLERGERNPTLRTVERIAEKLGADPITLLQELGDPVRGVETHKSVDL